MVLEEILEKMSTEEKLAFFMQQFEIHKGVTNVFKMKISACEKLINQIDEKARDIGIESIIELIEEFNATHILG